MVPRLKSYSSPPFLNRNALIPAALMACYFALHFAIDFFFPGATWAMLAVSVIVVAPICIYGYRASKRWKQLLAESDGYLCPWCGYNLRPTPDAKVCPECGRDPRDWRGW